MQNLHPKSRLRRNTRARVGEEAEVSTRLDNPVPDAKSLQVFAPKLRFMPSGVCCSFSDHPVLPICSNSTPIEQLEKLGFETHKKTQRTCRWVSKAKTEPADGFNMNLSMNLSTPFRRVLTGCWQNVFSLLIDQNLRNHSPAPPTSSQTCRKVSQTCRWVPLLQHKVA